MIRFYLKIFISFFTLAIYPNVSTATEPKQILKTVEVEPSSKPFFELGIVGGTGWVPDYPAANEGKLRGIVLPYIRLRGQVIRQDEEDGARARLVHKSKWDFDLSASASFPASSEDNRARNGMDDLDWLGEVGPRVSYYFWEDDNEDRSKLKLGLPIRSVYSTNLKSGHHRGYTFAPSLSYDRYNFLKEGWTLVGNLTVDFVNEEFADYFYEVAEKDVRTNRRRYDAKAGYLGTGIGTGIKMKMSPKFTLISYAKANLYSGSSNQDSPLFKSEFTMSGFISIIWFMYETERRGFN